MVALRHVFWLWALLVIGFVNAARIEISGQTPETKPKATASVAGRVTIGDKPAPGVVVVANLLASPQTLVAQAICDAEGKYRLTGLVPTGLAIGVYAPTYVVPTNPMSAQGRMVLLSADEVVEGVDFKLTRGGAITGRITDAEGKPVMEERITIALVDEKGEPLRMPPRVSNPFMFSTDDRGIYRVYGLAAGKYKVSVGDNGNVANLRSGYYAKTFYPGTADAAKATIVELTEGGEAKNIDITLPPRSQTYTASGRFIDADTGQPLANVNYAFGALQQNQNQTLMAGYSSPGTPTNSKGEFRLEGIAPGRYGITATTSSIFNPDQPKIYSDPVPFEITDADVTNLEVKAQRGLTISGVVVPDGITNKEALAGLWRLTVSGYVEPGSTGIQVFSTGTISQIGPDGSFQLEGLRPGRVGLSVVGFAASGYGKGYTISHIMTDRELPNRQLELTSGQNVSGVRIYVTYGTGIIKGEVKAESGVLPSDVLMFVNVRRENSQVASAQVDARGRFTVVGIPSGTFDVMLQFMPLDPRAFPSNLLRPQRQTVTVSDGSETPITFTLDSTPKEKP